MMNQIRDHFLADSAFARDQDIRFRRRHRVDQLFDLLHRLALEHWREAHLCYLQSLLEFFGLLPQFLRFAKKRLLFQCLLDEAEQFLWRVGLANEMIRAAFDRFDRIVERVVRGQNDDLRFRALGFDLIEHLQSFRVRQLQIEENERRRFIFQCF